MSFTRDFNLILYAAVASTKCCKCKCECKCLRTDGTLQYDGWYGCYFFTCTLYEIRGNKIKMCMKKGSNTHTHTQRAKKDSLCVSGPACSCRYCMSLLCSCVFNLCRELSRCLRAASRLWMRSMCFSTRDVFDTQSVYNIQRHIIKVVNEIKPD